MTQLLLVEDERLLRWALHRRLTGAGHSVDQASTLADAAAHLEKRCPSVVLLDVHLPDGNGIDFLAQQQARLSESAVIIMTGEGSIEEAVRAMKLGARDFLTKPVDQDELLRMVQRATEVRREKLDAEVTRRAREKQTRVRVVAESAAMKDVLRMADTVAGSGAPTVLILGETGVGKEVIARYVHAQSPRASAPLVALNCGALPLHLAESELFGYEKGAFTDARSSRKGLFELADSGTVVLDEIGEIPLALQAKLLRFLEERTVRRLGGSREISVDVRVLALTNRSLPEAVERGEFREDIFYRLNVFPIHVPSLRERREDIVPLAIDFMRQFGAMAGKRFADMTSELKQRLVDYRWPGNVRELRNLIERACIVEEGEILTGHSLLVSNRAMIAADQPGTDVVPIMPLDELEYLMVMRALAATSGNQSRAARLLQVTRDQLRYRLKRYREAGRDVAVGEE